MLMGDGISGKLLHFLSVLDHESFCLGSDCTMEGRPVSLLTGRNMCKLRIQLTRFRLKLMQCLYRQLYILKLAKTKLSVEFYMSYNS